VAVGGGETAYVSESRNVKNFRHDPDFFPPSANAGRAAHIVCQELLTDPNSRMALGADTMRILRMVISQGAWQLVIGLVLGAGGVALLIGVVAAAALKNILFKVNPLDPTIYLAVAGLLTLVAALSCFLPARRATRVDPIVALRYE
jgi:FtsX-like permease family